MSKREILEELQEEISLSTENLKFELTEESYSFNVCRLNDSTVAYRITENLEDSKTTAKGPAPTATAMVIENNDYVVIGLDVDLPFLHAKAMSYVVTPKNTKIEDNVFEYIKEFSSVVMLGDNDVHLSQLKEHEVDIIKVDLIQLHDKYDASQHSLVDLAIMADADGYSDPLNTINKYIHKAGTSNKKRELSTQEVIVPCKSVVEPSDKETHSGVEDKNVLLPISIKVNRMSIKLADITVREDFQARVQMNEESINNMCEAILNGESIPPIEVMDVNGVYILTDGNHRYQAYKVALRRVEDAESLEADGAKINKNSLESVDCNVQKGTEVVAFIAAIGANATQLALPRSNNDKKRAVRLALSHQGIKDESNRGIAKICHVSHVFVAKVRKEIQDEANPVSGNITTEEADEMQANPTVHSKTTIAKTRPFKINNSYIHLQIDIEEDVIDHDSYTQLQHDLQKIIDKYVNEIGIAS